MAFKQGKPDGQLKERRYYVDCKWYDGHGETTIIYYKCLTHLLERTIIKEPLLILKTYVLDNTYEKYVCTTSHVKD